MFIAGLIIGILTLIVSIVLYVIGKSKMKDSTARSTFLGLFVLGVLLSLMLPIFSAF